MIVALTDVLGTTPSAAFAGHGAAKAAQIMLVASLAKAWAPDGVRVCGVAPGPIDLPDDPRREATVRAAAKSATGHLVAAAEIARAVRFMIACDALTGVNLPVDGGELLGRPVALAEAATPKRGARRAGACPTAAVSSRALSASQNSMRSCELPRSRPVMSSTRFMR